MNKNRKFDLMNLRVEEWYDRRKAMLKPSGERNLLTTGIGVLFAVVAIWMLLMASWVPTDHRDFIKQQANLYSVEPSDWYVSNLGDYGCSLDLDCYERQLSLESHKLSTVDQVSNSSETNKFIVINLSLLPKTLVSLRNEPLLTISLPLFRYERAEVYIDGNSLGNFHHSQRLSVSIPRSDFDPTTTMEVSVVLELPPSDRSIAGKRDNIGVLVGSHDAYNQFIRYLHSKSSGTVVSMGSLAKVVLALFCILLFLIVDSSPESLGLALFMGFEAVALGIGRGWVPLGWFGFNNDLVLTNFCYQMGDILKVYFFLQLARIGKPSVWPWLAVGALLSVPYGFFMEYAHANSFSWHYKIPRMRDTLAGSTGLLVCAQAYWAIRRDTLPWRKSALGIGMLAALVEVSKSWVAHSELSTIYPIVATAYGMLEANLGYLFALSTFLNISTLENRVRTLTEEKDKANEMKRQMELGQSLQKAFLTLPKLPKSVSLTCYHEAAVYVSGDTYFVHWNKGRNRLTFLLNDVTGFGVQAALKAFAANVIARTIWFDSAEGLRRKADRRRRTDRRRQESNLEKYDQLIDQLLCRNSNESTDDFNAMIGAEFNVRTGELELYRANYNFPFIVSPEFEWTEYEEGPIELWNCAKVQLKNREIMRLQLKPGSFVVFVSDGYIENSRAELSFLRSMNQNISATRRKVTTTTIQSLALDWAKKNGIDQHNDDRTMMVFQWVPQAEIIDQPDHADMVKTA